MTSDTSRPAATIDRRYALTVCVSMVLALWCWLEARTFAAKKQSHDAMLTQVEGMSADALAISALRTAPRLAADRERPNDELLGQVRDALTAASVPLDRWIGNDPSMPVRVLRTPYKRLSVRLLFEDLTMKQMAAFAYHLIDKDPTLSVSQLRVSAPTDRRDDTWDVDLHVSYLIYAPSRENGWADRP